MSKAATFTIQLTVEEYNDDENSSCDLFHTLCSVHSNVMDVFVFLIFLLRAQDRQLQQVELHRFVSTPCHSDICLVYIHFFKLRSKESNMREENNAWTIHTSFSFLDRSLTSPKSHKVNIIYISVF